MECTATGSEMHNAREPGPRGGSAVIFTGPSTGAAHRPMVWGWVRFALALNEEFWTSSLSADAIHLTFEDSLHNW